MKIHLLDEFLKKFARWQAAISDRKAIRMIFFFYLLIVKQV